MVINPIVGVYIPIIRIPIKGGMTIPNIATFDHGTCINRLLTSWDIQVDFPTVLLTFDSSSISSERKTAFLVPQNVPLGTHGAYMESLPCYHSVHMIQALFLPFC